MSELVLDGPLLEIAESGKITADNVLTLRRHVFADDRVSRNEAEALLALDLSARTKSADWGHYFSEALVNFIVYQEDPEGHISSKNADWLIHCISRDGLVDSAERMEMLVKVLERAETSPVELMQFALSQVSHAVLHNQGPLAKARTGENSIICEADVDVIRRLIFAFGGEGGMAVTRTEAEFLFDLNDKTIEAENDPAWSDLFAKGVGNYVLATLGNAVPSRTVALAQDEWLGGETFIDTMVNSLRAVYRTVISPTDAVEAAIATNNSAFSKGLEEASILTNEEVEWIAKRIGADGYLHENEKALLQFLSEEPRGLPVELQSLLDKAA